MGVENWPEMHRKTFFFLSRRTINFSGCMSTQCLSSQIVYPVITTYRLCNSKRSRGLHPGLSLLKPRMGLFLLTSSEFRCARSKENSVGRATWGNSVSVVSALILSAWGKGELDSLGAIRGRLKHTSIVLGKALFFLPCKPGVGLKGKKRPSIVGWMVKKVASKTSPPSSVRSGIYRFKKVWE